MHLVPGEHSSQTKANTFAHDVFVVHAAADESFVQGYLLPELGLVPERVLVPKKLRPGRLIIGELERGVRSSRVTIVVLSPAYVTDHWAVFGEQLAAYESVAKDAHGELVPLMLGDCELPTHIRALVKLDFRDPARDAWTAQTDRLRRYFDRPAVPESDLPCPYPGMRPFTEQDASRFFGRDAERDDIIRRLRRGEREIYVIGASGSGKSSLIAAGLLPTLARRTAGLPSFHVQTLRPGERPGQRLTDALEGDLGTPIAAVEQLLARHAPATSLLLVIDQLEELFAIASPDERLGFLAAIRTLRADPRCTLVFTLRADFYGVFMESALWRDVDGRISRIELGALRDDSLWMVIEHPARDLGVYFQPELVSQLLRDAADEPGALPLLQEALFQLWGKRRQRLLALAEYQALGDGTRTGLAFAISEHADAVLRTLTRAQETIAFRILLRLVNFGEGRADTRRQQLRATLHSDDESAADFNAVLQRLVDNRLVTVTGDDQRGDVRVDLAHEILLHAWSKFADWIRIWRPHEQRRRELESAATAWRAWGGGDGGLLDPVELVFAVAWRANAGHQLGHSADLAAFLAASEAAQARAIRQRQRLVRLAFAAVAALVVVGTLSGIRIINERARANQAARHAILRAEQLTLAQARSNVDVDPTKSVAMVKPLVTKYWREVRAIAAAARAAGVAWSAPASQETLSLEMSHDGRRALSAGDDGVVRIHDLDQRTTRPILDLHIRAMARFADAERQIVIWPENGTSLVLLDATTGQRRDLTTNHAIARLEIAGNTAYWIDDQHALWQLDLASTVPTRIPLEEPVVALAPSPDGHWLALSSDHHLFLYDRTRPTAPWRQAIQGSTRDLQWSTAGPAPDGEHFAAVIAQQWDDLAIDVAVGSGPQTVKRRTLWSRQTPTNPRFVAVSGDLLYVMSRRGVAIVSHDEAPTPCEQREPYELHESPGPPVLKQIRGYPVGIVESRGGTVVAGATDGLTVISADGDHLLPLQGAHIEGVLASPRSPYVIALLESRLLVWNLDDVQPRRLTNERPDGARFATSDQVITGGTDGVDNFPAQSIDVVTATARSLGDWPGLRAVTAPDGGHVAAVIDGAKHVHVIGPGRPPEDLPGEIDIAGFATQDQLVFATPGGEIYVYDVARHQRTPLVPRHAALLGLAWGHGHHPWVAAAFADGTLWRKNLATGASATTARTPALDLAHPTDRDGKLLAGEDGTVLFLHDREVHAWRANGGIERLASLPKPILDFGEAGTSHVLAFANDRTIYTIASMAPNHVTEARAIINDVSASMSPDTGLLVTLDRGNVRIIDPLGNWQWQLALASGVTFADPVISTDGRRVLAQAISHVAGRPEHSLVVWSIELPATPADTVKWLDAMTNAVEDPGSPGLGWR